MRRLLAVLMLLPLLLLAGCGKEEEQTQQALDFRTRLLEAGGCATATILKKCACQTGGDAPPEKL